MSEETSRYSCTNVYHFPQPATPNQGASSPQGGGSAPPQDAYIGLPLGYAVATTRRAMGFLRDPSPPASLCAPSLIVDNTERHALIVAPTGSGKGRNILLPWLIDYPGSVVVVDPKAEAVAVTAQRRVALGQKVAVFDPWKIYRPGGHANEPHTINPMQVMLDGADDLGDACMTLAELLVGPAPASTQDPFWRNNALDLICALMGWVWVRARITAKISETDRCIHGVWDLLHHDDLCYELAVLLDTQSSKLPAFVRRGFINFVQHEGEKVRTSVRSEAVSLMRIFASDSVQAATRCTTVPLDALREGDEGVSLFLVFPPEKLESHAALLRIVLASLLSVMTRRRARPEVATLFLVDELAHIGPISQLKQAVTLLRGYGVRVALFLQSIAQLKGLWPKDYETILENCGLWLNFGNTTQGAARSVSDNLGDLSADNLFAMNAGQLAIHRGGEATIIAQRLDYLVDARFQGRYEPNPFYQPRGGGRDH